MLYIPSAHYVPHKPTGAKLALKPVHVWGIRVRLQVARQARDLALFDLALDSKLRGCDLVRLRVSDLLSPGGVKRRVVILQQKTGRPEQFEVTDQTRRSIADWISHKGLALDDWLFPSQKKVGGRLSTRQYARRVDKWVSLLGLDPAAYGTHSLAAIQSLRAPSDILAWKVTTRSSFQKRWSYERLTSAMGRKRTLACGWRKLPAPGPGDDRDL